MAKFKEWFYKKISEDTFQPAPLNFQSDLSAILTKQTPASPVQQAALNPALLANKLDKAASPALKKALGMQPDIQKAALASASKGTTTGKPGGTTTQGAASSMINPLTTPQQGITPSSTDFS